MNVFGRLFGKRYARVEAERLGRGLAEMAAVSAGQDALDFLTQDLPDSKPGDAFLALATLSLFAWIRTAENEPLRLGSSEARTRIYQTMSSFLVVHYVTNFDEDAHPDAVSLQITQAAFELIAVWNRSQDKPPSPHWHVAKEVWFSLARSRENPDPVMITTLSGIMSTETVTFLEFARQVEVVD